MKLTTLFSQFIGQQALGHQVIENLSFPVFINCLGNMRSSRAARLNILKKTMAVSNLAGLSFFYH